MPSTCIICPAARPSAAGLRTASAYVQSIEFTCLIIHCVPLCTRWRNFLSPDIEHPRKSPFTEWEIAVVVLVSIFGHENAH